ncbi:XRE family transcriptional regulator [Actinoalloteichus sp. AHMU CJ021]|nr:helix-turn-helix transcriptional regulator [Actinoalloteichus caeruleus]AUS77418.1 XRE family transcriptional regulator [Actinoalloteichus sp. AHMU CJ021]
MAEESTLFGAELRRLRRKAGLSLGEFANLAHYSKGYLSKLENGSKPARPDVARRCDAVLHADGRLASLATPRKPEPATTEVDSEDREVWLMNLTQGGSSWFRPMNRRDALALGAGSLMGFTLTGQGVAATAAEQPAVDLFRALFENLRTLAQTASPSVVLPSLVTQTDALRNLAGSAPERTRVELLALCARYAELTGWMAQESGNDQSALWWTRLAVDLATEGHDPHLVTYSLVQRALVTLYREDAAQTIDLSRRAQRDGHAPGRVLALAASREAQGHALAGDHTGCHRALDRSRELFARQEDNEGPVLGTTTVADVAEMTAGWCLFELGRPAQAVEVLEKQVEALPATALRSRARWGLRLALAHAAAGEVDQACALAERLLPAVTVVSSATVAVDLRRLTRTLARWHTHRAVHDLYPRLTAALRSEAV